MGARVKFSTNTIWGPKNTKKHKLEGGGGGGGAPSFPVFKCHK